MAVVEPRPEVGKLAADVLAVERAAGGLESGPPEARLTPGKRRIIFFTLAAAMMMSAIDQTVVATALQTIHTSLHSPINWSSWTVTTYQLGLVLSLPVAGRISDQFGRKKVFICCIILFVTSSAACGFAPNIYVLVACRGIQALGGGGFVPSATGIVADNFGGSRDRAIGMFSSIVPIGAMIGPIFGALIIAGWSWRGVFLVNIPIGVMVFFLAIRLVPRAEPRDAPPADIAGVGLLALAVLPMMFAITGLGDKGATPLSLRFIGLIAISICFIVWSVKHASRSPAPIIPIHLMRQRSFAAMNVISFIYGGCVLGFGALVPLYAEERFHVAPLEAGTLLTGRAIGAIVMAGVSAMLLRRIGYRLPIAIGLGLAAIGFVLLGILPPLGFGVFAWLVFSSTFTGAGNGVAAPATNNAMYSFAPGEIATIAGIRGMFRQVAAIISISIVTAVANRGSDPGVILGHAFIVFALIIVIFAMPPILLVPDTRGKW